MSLHNDITKTILEFEHNGHKAIIVERKFKMAVKPFLYFYVFDIAKNRQHGGMHYVFFEGIEKEDLADLSIAVPKIKAGIDKMVSTHMKWEEEKIQKKKDIGWAGQRFNRGDAVHFKGNNEYKAIDTWVWTFFGHMSLEYYIIEHEDGEDRDRWLAKPPFEDHDGFECVHSSELKAGLKYIQIDCKEFQGETDELVLIKKDN